MSRQIVIANVSKAYNGETILENLSLEIPSGKFFALLGPSGCGKTTLLRLIAGLESVDSGTLHLGTQDITNQPIYERRINTVFQQYALFPHLTVFENVAYSLRIKRLPEKEVVDRVRHVLGTVRLRGHEYKYIRHLSGGQQQRVALARAIINEPEVLLLDEPLAALDLNLREKMLLELIDLQEKLQTTFLYVTHDQAEALTVADKMAIMNGDGGIEQIGTPQEIYEFPISRFVAQFVGTTNIFGGTLRVNDDAMSVEVDGLGEFSVFTPVRKSWMLDNASVFMSIRPEKIHITKTKSTEFSNVLGGTVDNKVYHGRYTLYKVKLVTGQIVSVFMQNENHFPSESIDYDDEVFLCFQRENAVLLER